MSEYNLKITDIDWTEGNVYEIDKGVVYIVKNKNLVRKATGHYMGEEYDLAGIAKLTFKRVFNWAKVPVDAKILVRADVEDKWEKRHFAKYKNGKVYCFIDGQTSWSSDNDLTMPWNYAKLAEEGKE